jgi:hypothetical protein
MTANPMSAGLPDADRSALKEWASVMFVLDRGATVLLLRKGGIYEQKQGFQVEHRRFWVFPTRFHQNADELHPAFEWALPGTAASEPEGATLRIGVYADVTDALRVERFDLLDRLTGHHPLASSTVHARFHYKGRPYLHVLVVRAYRLAEPHRIKNLPEYDGCVSWVELADPLATAGVEPVLETEEFDGRRAEILEVLDSDGVTRLWR